MSIVSRAVEFLFGSQIDSIVKQRVNLTVAARDDSRDRTWGYSGTNRDRQGWTRDDVLKDCFTAWRENPLARRIVGLTSQYVVGGGLGVSCEDEGTNEFLKEWWDHRLNRMVIRTFEWCDELTRAGELFVVLSTDAGGMTYLRAIPAQEIQDIQTAENDLEQELAFIQKPPDISHDGIRWQGYNETDDGQTNDGKYADVMLHYAINRPVGAKFGESDLAPLRKWLLRFDGWLEDRVRLNHWRQIFVWILKKAFRDEAERLARQSEVNANPPSPGSVLVIGDDESWEVAHPRLDSFEANADGLAIKKNIATGAGVPLHFLAEPESSTRTTAEQAGGPTFRHFEQRQIFFLWMMRDIAKIAVKRASRVRRGVKGDAIINARGTDIFARDNAGLAASAAAIVDSFLQLRALNLIDDAELLRLSYKFAGEIVDVQKILADGKKAPKIEIPKAGSDKQEGAKVPSAQDIAKKDI